MHTPEIQLNSMLPLINMTLNNLVEQLINKLPNPNSYELITIGSVGFICYLCFYLLTNQNRP